jgi:putative oxidoreductase
LYIITAHFASGQKVREQKMQIVIAILRIGMGLYLLANGLNFFFEFLVLPPVENETANLLMAGFIQSGMFEIVKVVEVVGGLALIFNFYVPLALVVAYPIVVIIAYIDILILKWELGGIVNGGIFFAVFTALMFFYLPYFRGMFTRKAVPATSLAALKQS